MTDSSRDYRLSGMRRQAPDGAIREDQAGGALRRGRNLSGGSRGLFERSVIKATRSAGDSIVGAVGARAGKGWALGTSLTAPSLM
jgi:hypothetical protein